MLSAKPLHVFHVGNKQIIVCQLVGDNPMLFLGHDFSFYAHGRLAGRIRIEGISTASDSDSQVFDFTYSGDEILPEQLGEQSVIRDDEPELA